MGPTFPGRDRASGTLTTGIRALQIMDVEVRFEYQVALIALQTISA